MCFVFLFVCFIGMNKTVVVDDLMIFINSNKEKAWEIKPWVQNLLNVHSALYYRNKEVG